MKFEKMRRVLLETKSKPKKKGPLPPVKSTNFWTEKFGDGKVDDASPEALFARAKDHPDGLLGGIRSLQLIASYGSFPKSKMSKLWDMYNANKKDKKKSKKSK